MLITHSLAATDAYMRQRWQCTLQQSIQLLQVDNISEPFAVGLPLLSLHLAALPYLLATLKHRILHKQVQRPEFAAKRPNFRLQYSTNQ